jgi:hypothetical protein
MARRKPEALAKAGSAVPSLARQASTRYPALKFQANLSRWPRRRTFRGENGLPTGRPRVLHRRCPLADDHSLEPERISHITVGRFLNHDFELPHHHFPFRARLGAPNRSPWPIERLPHIKQGSRAGPIAHTRAPVLLLSTAYRTLSSGLKPHVSFHCTLRCRHAAPLTTM